MPHIHTKPGQHDHTISLYIFRIDFDQPKVMLHFHRKIKRYAQFGGHIELHENPWQATIHELKEESGYDINQLHILQPPTNPLKMTTATVHPFPAAHATLSYPGQDKHFHTDIVYAFTATDEPTDPPAMDESNDIQLFTRQELIALGEDKVDEVTRETAVYIFDNYLTQWQSVPTETFQ